MRVIVQRVKMANVMVDGRIVGNISNGYLLLVGFKYDDTIKDVEYMAKKIINLRIFDDENGKMNLNILDVGGSILSVSQFTLYADTTSGNRPSFTGAMGYDEAKILYDKFNEILKDYLHVECGIFGSNMQVSLINDGPVTNILESVV